MDYSHGTGHGVGFYSNVHEGPISISRTNSHELKPGMVISNEPGYYKENEYGISTENLIIIKENIDNKLYFENISWCPIDLDLIERNTLDKIEKQWLNKYHEEVYNKLESYLENNERIWLKKATYEI